MNRLLSKGMSNIYVRVIIEAFSKLQFSGFKKFVTRSEIKNQRSGSQTVRGFSIILILKGIMTF